MKEQILTSAQRLVQQRGFNGFSYADVAVEVGIRKASLHHHFATKADLGLALIERYSLALSNELARISSLSVPADEKLRAYIAIYHYTLAADRVCMGGMLASDALTLEGAMLPSLKHFFAINTDWLTELLAEGNVQQTFTLSSTAANHARLLVSALQGALMLARATSDRDAFEQTCELLISNLMRKG
ncbi:MAG: TetR/AcrR family transcriptional regulator [Methylotenera sp.]|nr:TetR/AcrR family transcriptional regulator [Methylotenera sp.]